MTNHFLLHKGQKALKNRGHASGFSFCSMPFQTPTELADGLGTGSSLLPVIKVNTPQNLVPPHPLIKWI